MEEKPLFNYKDFEEDAIRRLRNGEALEGKDGILDGTISVKLFTKATIEEL